VGAVFLGVFGFSIFLGDLVFFGEEVFLGDLDFVFLDTAFLALGDEDFLGLEVFFADDFLGDFLAGLFELFFFGDLAFSGVEGALFVVSVETEVVDGADFFLVDFFFLPFLRSGPSLYEAFTLVNALLPTPRLRESLICFRAVSKSIL